MQFALGTFLVIHGFAHMVGFAVPWKLIENADSPYRTTVLNGHLEVGDTGVRVAGVLWLILSIAFVAAGIGMVLGLHWWQPLMLYTTVASLLLCIVGWPDSRIGVPINIFILGYLILI